LRLWGLVELLTGTQENERHANTVRRAAYLFAEYEIATEVLTQLAWLRHRYVHVAAGTDDIEERIYQLKFFVEKLLKFHLGNRFRFKGLSEAREFLDLPPKEGRLNEEIRLRRFALKYAAGR
jgi:hypothetical protein